MKMFVKYKNVDGDSHVDMYEIGRDYISVIFIGSRKIYTYSYSSAGAKHVENMKALAIKGNGLNSYINKNCRNMYVKW